MARKKSAAPEEAQVFDNIFEGLAKGTDFKLSSQSSVLTQRSRVRTPVEALNCVLGGGIPFGTVAQSYGPPKVGKSTWMYQTLGIFQKQYPNGVAMVVDMEASADGERIEYLGVDTSKLLRLPATSIENGFTSLMKVLENKQNIPELKEVPVFVIWDTISKGLAQDGATQSRMNAMDRARIIKNYMSPIMAQIEKQDFILCLLNQVIYTQDSYGNRKMDSGGGIALKHDVHFSTRITSGSDEWDGNFKIRTRSVIDIDKSKLGPEIWGIPMVIDIQEGGVIDEVMSFTDYLIKLGLIDDAKGWYKFDSLLNRSKEHMFYSKIYENNKSYRYQDLVDTLKNNKLLLNIFRYLLMEFIAGKYRLQAKVMKDYQDKCLEDIRAEYDPPELYLKDNQEKINEVVETIRSNPELKETIKANLPTCKMICLNCGTTSEYAYPCDHCQKDLVVTKGLAEEIMKLVDPEPMNNTESEGDNNGESSEQDPDN